MNEDLIIKLFRYFSRFVSINVLKETMIQPEFSRFQGYSEIQAEILTDFMDITQNVRIPEIEKFVLSINEKFVSEKIKNSKGLILFVEYGNISADFKRANGVKQLITPPVDIQVVDPTAFYGCGGWCAMFQNSTTIML